MSEKSGKAVTIWLLVVAVLIAVMVVVGGYVRLTRSGLSIVEWNPVTGVVPPLSEAAWQQEFAKYQQTPEFKMVNRDMTLDGYQRIYYLEWAHRLIARLAGLIVVLPLAFFLWKRTIPWRASVPYLLVAALFGLQGYLGWYMVSSGLVAAPQVSHFRLTIHLLAALLLLAMTLWLAFNRLYGQSGVNWRHWSGIGLLTLAIIVVQIAYGGLVAGLKAGHISNTWPLMFGVLAPAGMLEVMDSWLLSIVAASVTVHFIHRWLAFVVLAAALWLLFRQPAGKSAASRQVRTGAAWLVAVVLLQILLGIGVILFGVPIWLALLHQATAMVLFAVAIHLNHRLAHAL
ncbi:MAG: COX15/CtaA family protein [Caldilineaceae bacterium]|nr:COX15/CtaA family protein [Caldilineaceae bacterium]